MNNKRKIFELDYFYCPSCQSKLIFKQHEKKKLLSCIKCSFIFWNNSNPVVSALYIKNSKVLLIKRNNEVYRNYWALPGGVIDPLEEPEKALKREFYQETGYRIIRHKIIDAYLIIYAPKGIYRKPCHTSIDIVYTVKTNKIRSINTLNTEVKEVKFFPINKLPQKIAFGHKEIINKFS